MTDSGLKAVFLQERALLLRLLTARLQSAEEAEDALQDMWMKLERLEAGPIAQPVSYLCRMAMNLAADRRVAAIRADRRNLAWLEVQPGDADFPDPERNLIGRDMLNRLETYIAKMPARMGQALHMFRIEELPQREIAERLGITSSGVEKILKRAYREIHDFYAQASADGQATHRLTGRGDVDREA